MIFELKTKSTKLILTFLFYFILFYHCNIINICKYYYANFLFIFYKYLFWKSSIADASAGTMISISLIVISKLGAKITMIIFITINGTFTKITKNFNVFLTNSPNNQYKIQFQFKWNFILFIFFRKFNIPKINIYHELSTTIS